MPLTRDKRLTIRSSTGLFDVRMCLSSPHFTTLRSVDALRMANSGAMRSASATQRPRSRANLHFATCESSNRLCIYHLGFWLRSRNPIDGHASSHAFSMQEQTDATDLSASFIDSLAHHHVVLSPFSLPRRQTLHPHTHCTRHADPTWLQHSRTASTRVHSLAPSSKCAEPRGDFDRSAIAVRDDSIGVASRDTNARANTMFSTTTADQHCCYD